MINAISERWQSYATVNQVKEVVNLIAKVVFVWSLFALGSSIFYGMGSEVVLRRIVVSAALYWVQAKLDAPINPFWF